MPTPQTVPCQYKTGNYQQPTPSISRPQNAWSRLVFIFNQLEKGSLGQRSEEGLNPLLIGTYAVVKEAVHISTGKYYACKVINKRLMEGREHMVRNEINVLKKISAGHPNIVTLHDYFETLNNLYLVTDLCQGGELFDRICAKGQYYERDARHLVKVVLNAVEYLHSHGILLTDVHLLIILTIDLKPENLLFRGPEDTSDLLIADFGLSRVIDDSKFNALTTTCGTPGMNLHTSYMAPEIFKKSGHGKPVDIWAIGVITYFLLCGYTPFDKDDSIAEIRAICDAAYKFEPAEYWKNVSNVGAWELTTPRSRDFIAKCLTVPPEQRLTSRTALEHPWFASEVEPGVIDPSSEKGETQNLLPHLKRQFDAKKTFRKAIATVRASNRFRQSTGVPGGTNPEMDELIKVVEAGQADAAAESETVNEVLAT
ncbi:CAMK/CAMK1 protein kinase [Puccinia sorghi]|uniref:CAMK/CAMK1 protein kinase n=1 Tax=Puccinia sorghi TaxID=27349 RepID=A0A0L6UTT2_9BASI|nr:CAMK/CAMK1 protein kinase [Puccinia sorghi]